MAVSVKLSAYPDLVAEFDLRRNQPKVPEDFTHGSHKRVWWLCLNNHRWETEVKQRTILNTGCPLCSGLKAIRGVNDLTVTSPDLASQWDYSRNGTLTPEEVTINSSRQAWWLCAGRHSWRAPVRDRSSGNGCPVCVNKKVLRGYNDLETTNPDIASQWDASKNLGGLSPREVTKGSRKRIWWLCGLGHSWRAAVSSRSRGSGCPFCSGHLVIYGETDLGTRHPHLAEEWDFEKNTPLTPREVTSYSSKKAWWLCIDGHSWRAVIDSRARGNGCPECFRLREGSKVEAALCRSLGANTDETTLPIKWPSGHNYKVDGLLQGKIAIEYDGAYWHGKNFPKRKAQDDEKTSTLIANGYTVVRVRENDLPFLPPQGGLIQVRHMLSTDALEDTAKGIQRLLADYLD